MKNQLPRRQRKQAGFTLIEVMIAMLILLVGLLGVAGMQIVSFQNNQGAYLRSQATFIAADFLDRIRANSADRIVPSGGAFDTSYDGLDTRSVTLPATQPCTSACNGAALALHDIEQLAQRFADTPPLLPNGYATVDVTTSTAGGNTLNEYVVTVFWSEKGWSGDNGEVQRDSNVANSVQLRTVIK